MRKSKKVQELPWMGPFREFLATLDPEEAMKPTKYERAFAAGWTAAKKRKGKKS